MILFYDNKLVHYYATPKKAAHIDDCGFSIGSLEKKTLKQGFSMKIIWRMFVTPISSSTAKMEKKKKRKKTLVF